MHNKIIDNIKMIKYCLLIAIIAFGYYMWSGGGRVGIRHRESFISSNKFAGAKKGYVFKNDSKGIGYYEDL